MITKKRVLGIIIYTVVALAIFIHAPMEAEALITPILEVDVYGDASVMIDVTAEHIIGTGWDLHYTVSAVSRDVRYMSFGLVDPVTSASYANVITADDYDAVPQAAFNPVTASSFFPYFSATPLAAGMSYEFTIHFLGDGGATDHSAVFDGGQRITVRDVSGTMVTLTAYYEQPHNPGPEPDGAIPEPATLLILGMGIVILGMWSRKGWKA